MYFMTCIYYYALDAHFKCGSFVTKDWIATLARKREQLGGTATVAVVFLRSLEPLECRRLDEFRAAGVEVEQ